MESNQSRWKTGVQRGIGTLLIAPRDEKGMRDGITRTCFGRQFYSNLLSNIYPVYWGNQLGRSAISPEKWQNWPRRKRTTKGSVSIILIYKEASQRKEAIKGIFISFIEYKYSTLRNETPKRNNEQLGWKENSQQKT